MKESEAVRVTKLLSTLFPHDALDPECATEFAREVALLRSATAALEAARHCARALDKFPTVREFREIYGSIREADARPEPVPRIGQPCVDPSCARGHCVACDAHEGECRHDVGYYLHPQLEARAA